MTGFKAVEVNEHLQDYIDNYKTLIRENEKRLLVIGSQFDQELRAFQQREFLTIAFIGEYSAGKSSMVAALTNRRDIKICPDITTETTTAYDWNGIKLIDTPGLFTDRQDHDQITYEAIRQADLLVFCLTHSLFDDVTVENFKKLAFEEKYASKMMLVVNKMSSEAGDDEVKIQHYKKSLQDALGEHSLDQFPVCFVDARDYLDGIDEDDEEFKEASRFSTFIDALNEFVYSKGMLAKLDTPIRITINSLHEASSALSRTTEEDNAFLELLNKLSRGVARERQRLQRKVKEISADLSLSVTKTGMMLSLLVGSDAEIKSESKIADAQVAKEIEAACATLESVVHEAQQTLQNEIQNTLSGELMFLFCAKLQTDEFNIENFTENKGGNRFTGQLKILGKIGNLVGVKVGRMATGTTRATQGLIAARGASGSILHQGLTSSTRFIGFSVRPMHAANIVKTIGRMGAVLAILGVAVEVGGALQEVKNERKLAEARKYVNSEFTKRAEALEKQFSDHLKEVETALYDVVDKDIAQAREDEENAIAASNEQVAAAVKIRQSLELFMESLHNPLPE
ncbi:MAG: GTPase [Candidatus Hydrogenedentes bacterium]|nr:GTPase [Candidatus Hydrogenedentota bacterium]